MTDQTSGVPPYNEKLNNLINSNSTKTEDWLPVLAQCFMYQQQQIEHSNKRFDVISKRLFGDEEAKQIGLIDEIVPVIIFFKKYFWIASIVWPITTLAISIIIVMILR